MITRVIVTMPDAEHPHFAIHLADAKGVGTYVMSFDDPADADRVCTTLATAFGVRAVTFAAGKAAERIAS